MIGHLLDWVACPPSAVRTQRRTHGLIGHRSWRPMVKTPPGLVLLKCYGMTWWQAADARRPDGAKVIGMTAPPIREATIRALRRTKADPRSLRLTPGQRKHITGGDR